MNADDVIIEAGDASKGDGGPNGVGTKKDVGIRADRADGFVLQEPEGPPREGARHLRARVRRLPAHHFKAYYNGLYGTLTFVEDHGVQQHCDAVGHGDSGIYPGAAVETGEQRPAGTDVPLQPGDPVLRPAPQHGGVLGDQRQRRLGPPQPDLRQRAGAADRRRHRRRPSGLPGRLDARSRTTGSTRTTSTSTRRTRASTRRSRSRSAPACGSPAATTTRSATTTSATTGAAARCSSACPTSSSAARPPTATSRPGCDPNGQTTSLYNSHYDNFMGMRPDGTADPNGTDFWWDPYAGTIGNCWWDNAPAAGRGDHDSAAGRPLPELRQRHASPSRASAPATLRRRASCCSCVAAFETRTFDPNGPCPWFKTPPEPQPGGGTAARSRGAAFDCRHGRSCRGTSSGPINRRSDLSGVSCTDWNAAGDDDRAWLVDEGRASSSAAWSWTARRRSATATC